MKRALLPLIVCLLSAATFAADAPQPYGVFPRPTTQPTFKVYSSGFSPFTVIHNTGPRTLLFQDLESSGLAGPSHVAYVAEHKVRIAPTNAPIDPSNMTESWMLFLFHSSKGWPQIKNTPYPIDIPVFVVLQKMPSEIKPAGSGLEFTFPNESGYIALMPFFGTSFIRATQTAAWKDTLPQDIFLRCRMLAELSREYPIKVEETFKIFPAQDKVVIRDRFDFLSIDDEWKTGHKKIAPLEYPVALANRYKFRLLSVAGQVTDLDTPVGTGCWAGVEADECSYTLTGLLRYINTVEQPKQIPPDHPLLAEARKNFDWQLYDLPLTVESAPDFWYRVAPLATRFAYADETTQKKLRQEFKQIAALLLDPKNEPLSREKLPPTGDVLRGIHDMATSAHDLSLVKTHWPMLRDLYRMDTERRYWGNAMHSGCLDEDLTSAICIARMAYWLGDEEMYRRASCHTAKEFLALWTICTAYPKWVRERSLYASIGGYNSKPQVREENGSIVVIEREGNQNRTMAIEDLCFSNDTGANVGFDSSWILGFCDPSHSEMRFIKERMPEYAKYFLDTFSRKHIPAIHKAMFLDQSKFPANTQLSSKIWDQLLFHPGLNDWDFYFDVPLTDRSARHEKFWQNNGGIKGREFDIILAGIDRKYVSLWQGALAPQPDPIFRRVPLADNAIDPRTDSPVFVVRLKPDYASFSWLGIDAPDHGPNEPGPQLNLCTIRPR